MKWVKEGSAEGHPELSSQEARQARPGWPVLYVLLAGIAGTIIGFGLAHLWA